MLKLNAYGGRDLQNLLSMLNQCETDDLRVLRTEIHNHIHSRRVVKKKVAIRKRKRIIKKCPECGVNMVNVINKEFLPILGCKSCKYSEIING